MMRTAEHMSPPLEAQLPKIATTKSLERWTGRGFSVLSVMEMSQAGDRPSWPGGVPEGRGGGSNPQVTSVFELEPPPASLKGGFAMSLEVARSALLARRADRLPATSP